MGKGVFLSSHIMSEVEQLCDKVGIIKNGKIVDTGTLGELRHLTRVNMKVETERPVEGLAELKGVHGIKDDREGIDFQVDYESVGAVVELISKYGVKKFESAPPTLEELFMSHYDKVEV